MAALLPLRNYLFCFVELQQVRINCTDETLQAALQSQSTHQSQSLVRTWLHDEGHLNEVAAFVR